VNSSRSSSDNASRARVERPRAGHELVEQHAERVDVGPGIDVAAVEDLLRAHVLGRAEQPLVGSQQRLLGGLAVEGLGDAEVDHARHRLTVVHGHEHVRRLDVAVDDALVVAVLDRAADVGQQAQPVAGRKLVAIAELFDRLAVDELHREPRPAVGSRAAVEHLGNVVVVHARERFPFLLEPANDFGRVHADLDDLERDFAMHRLFLLGPPDVAEAAFTDRRDEAERTDAVTGVLGREIDHWNRERHGRGSGQEVVGLDVRRQQVEHTVVHLRIAGALAREQLVSLGRGQVEGLLEQVLDAGFVHEGSPGVSPRSRKSRARA